MNFYRFFDLNRYRRGLENCPQANLIQSVQAIFFLFFFPPRPSDEYDSAPRRNYTAHVGSFSPVSVNVKIFHAVFFQRMNQDKIINSPVTVSSSCSNGASKISVDTI